MMELYDLRKMSDEELDNLRVSALTEQERRANLAHIPDQVADLAKTYRSGGGDENALMDAISAPE